jgi:hypothetical protein
MTVFIAFLIPAWALLPFTAAMAQQRAKNKSVTGNLNNSSSNKSSSSRHGSNKKYLSVPEQKKAEGRKLKKRFLQSTPNQSNYARAQQISHRTSCKRCYSAINY